MSPGEAARVALREDACLPQRVVQDRQQPVDPVVHPRLAQRKEFAQDRLQGVRLEIDQQEQQLLLRGVQHALAAAARKPLARATGQRLVRKVQPLIAPRERGQQELKLWKRQPSKGQELPAIAL